MKKTPRNLILAALLLSACGAGAQQPPVPAKPEAPAPPATGRKIRNFDDVQAELDRVQKQLDELQQRGLPAPPPPPKVDFAESERALARAERDLRAQEGIRRSEMQRAREEMTRARRDLARMQADLPRIQEESRRSGETARRSVAEAGRSVARAREEMKEHQSFEEDLANAGLIDKNEYSIEHRDGKLYLDGKEQPASVYEKYSSFLDKHKKFRWTKSKNEFNIQNLD